MARKPKQNLDYTFILKLNKEDREKLDRIQLSGTNASELFRDIIRNTKVDDGNL